MKCPKCGQEMIHINSQHICTGCGIVASEFTPQDQVLSAIKEKLAQANSNSGKAEEYHSPIALAQAENQLNSQHKQPVMTDTPSPEEATLDKILKDMGQLAGSAAEPITSNPDLPNIEGVDHKMVIARPENESYAAGEDSHNSNDYIQDEILEKKIPQEEQPMMREREALAVTPVEMAVIAQEPPPEEQEIVYPSHQVNPILIKILVSVFAILLLSSIGYLFFMSDKGKNVINFIKNTGQTPSEN